MRQSVFLIKFSLSLLILKGANAFVTPRIPVVSNLGSSKAGIKRISNCGHLFSELQGTQRLLERSFKLKNFGSPTTLKVSVNASESWRPAVRSLLAAAALLFLDISFRKIMDLASLSFPSSLVGCGALLASLLFLPQGERLYNALRPGADLLAKWLPVFFVPSLVMLPLTDGGLSSPVELLKVAIVVVGGFFFTLLSTALSVIAVEKLLSSKVADENNNNTEMLELGPTNDKPEPRAFSNKLNNLLAFLSGVSGIAAVVTSRLTSMASYTEPLASFSLLSTTLFSFVFGARLPKKFTKVVHPLVTCTTITWAATKCLSVALGTSFKSMLKSYRTGSINPLTGGAGDLLIFLLGPAVVSLACQMYDRRKLMRENLLQVATGVGVSSFGGLFGTATAVRILQIIDPYLRLSLLSRNITSPLAMAIASILGADVSLAVSMVVFTGLIGANFGASILDAFGIKNPVARGLGIGSAAHGLGTAAFVNEKDAFPFSAIAMALTASACTVIVSIPIFKRGILQLALGYY